MHAFASLCCVCLRCVCACVACVCHTHNAARQTHEHSDRRTSKSTFRASMSLTLSSKKPFGSAESEAWARNARPSVRECLCVRACVYALGCDWQQRASPPTHLCVRLALRQRFPPRLRLRHARLLQSQCRPLGLHVSHGRRRQQRGCRRSSFLLLILFPPPLPFVHTTIAVVVAWLLSHTTTTTGTTTNTTTTTATAAAAAATAARVASRL